MTGPNSMPFARPRLDRCWNLWLPFPSRSKARPSTGTPRRSACFGASAARTAKPSPSPYREWKAMPHANPFRNAQTVKQGALLLLAAAIMAAPVWAQAPPRRTAYATTSETCDGWPRAQIGMAKGYCAGIVVAPPEDFNARILRLPRVLLPLPGGKDFLVTDVGRWQAPGGKLLRITAERGKPTVITPVLEDLYMPHGMMRGPDGKVYVNEQGRIF